MSWPAAAAAKSLQSCPTLWDPIDGSPPGSPIPGILQARTLEWVAISFSNAWKWKVKVKSFSPVWLFVTPWTAAYQAPLSIGFSRQEYWSGVPLPSPVSWPRRWQTHSFRSQLPVLLDFTAESVRNPMFPRLLNPLKVRGLSCLFLAIQQASADQSKCKDTIRNLSSTFTSSWSQWLIIIWSIWFG